MSGIFWFAWTWITNWLWGWGGLGTIICIALWAAWFFCPTIPFLERVLPYKTQLFYAALVATFITFGSTYLYSTALKTGYDNGVAVTKKAWDAANKKAEEDAKKRDEQIAADAEKRVQEETSEIQKQADDLQQQVKKYAEELAEARKSKNPGNAACILDDNDIKRLRDFR